MSHLKKHSFILAFLMMITCQFATASGPILIIFGTPNAGKSTISKAFLDKIQQEDVKNDHANDWILESFDQEISRLMEKRGGRSTKQIIYDILDQNIPLKTEYQALLSELKAEEERYLVLYIWRKGGLKIDSPEHLKTRFHTKSPFKTRLDALRDKIREHIGSLNNNEDDFIKAIAKRAAKRSQQGKATVLDLVSLHQRKLDPVERLEKLLKEYDGVGRRHYALTHVSLRDILDRMIERNRKAELSNNKINKRKLSNILHYPFVFRSTPNSKDQAPITQLTKSDFEYVVRMLESQHDKALENTLRILKKAYPFGAKNQINLYANPHYDSIHRNDSWDSIPDIVNDLVEVAKNMKAQ